MTRADDRARDRADGGVDRGFADGGIDRGYADGGIDRAGSRTAPVTGADEIGGGRVARGRADGGRVDARPLYSDALRTLTAWPDADPVRERFLALLAHGPETVWREHQGAHLTASALVVDAAGEKVLLCLHGRIGRWVQLGGHCEPGDTTVAGTALREATEESGIAGLVLDPTPIHLDVHPVVCSGGPSLHYDVRYAAIAPPGAVETVSAESAALGWFAPDALPEPLAHAVTPLIAPALARARR